MSIWSISVLMRVCCAVLERPGARGRDQRGEDADDRDHDQEFDEGETLAT